MRFGVPITQIIYDALNKNDKFKVEEIILALTCAYQLN